MTEYEDAAGEVLDEIDLGSARGGPTRAIEVEIVRPLNENDLEALAERAPTVANGGSAGQRLKRIGTIHHRLAQLVVEGQGPEEISALTGYSPSYIGAIQKDPSFQGLVAYYATNAELTYVDVLERMKTLQIG